MLLSFSIFHPTFSGLGNLGNVRSKLSHRYTTINFPCKHQQQCRGEVTPSDSTVTSPNIARPLTLPTSLKHYSTFNQIKYCLIFNIRLLLERENPQKVFILCFYCWTGVDFDKHWKMLLKGTATLMINIRKSSMNHESKSVGKWGRYEHLKNSIWPTFSCHFEYLISYQNFFNCLISSYQYYHSICVSADILQLYT